MITLSGKNKVQMDLYDHVWYATTTCPGMRIGCEHHPEIAGSYEIGKYCIPGRPEYDEERFYVEYVKELSSEPKISYLRDIVRRSENGEWFQLVFYEDDPNDGERKYMYQILKQMTNKLRIE